MNLVLAVLACVTPAAAGIHGFTARRPDARKWRRTQCGGPTGKADIPSRFGLEVSAHEQPLPEYPRPQMVRGSGDKQQLRDHGDPETWQNLNGMWEWQSAMYIGAKDNPPFGRTLEKSILVPFPVESCLSSVAPTSTNDLVQEMWYRLPFDVEHKVDHRTLLHFGGVDWQTIVYLNGQKVGEHKGGYDGFSFEVTSLLKPKGNELLLYVFDPSEHGQQPHGKQRASAISKPGLACYTPSSGIWQTVWMERVPNDYIANVKIDQASKTAVKLTVDVATHSAVAALGKEAPTVLAVVYDPETGAKVAEAMFKTGEPHSIEVGDSPKLWSPTHPHLYDVQISYGKDTVLSYFGLRTIGLEPAHDGKERPQLNGRTVFMMGFLDQSFWPDGLYTPPTDEALKFDIESTVDFGFNILRLHEKVNPERYYYHADKLGLMILQDMPQKYGGADHGAVDLYKRELKAMIQGRGNHPSIVQWTAFNEADCWAAFSNDEFADAIQMIKKMDPTRLVDADSGGEANDRHLGDVNDVHTYPAPGDVSPTRTQYGFVGEFGGLGVFVKHAEWVDHKCYAYKHFNRVSDQVSHYQDMVNKLKSRVDHISGAVYTQLTDIEFECDGFLTYSRQSKFGASETKAIRNANRGLLAAHHRYFYGGHEGEHDGGQGGGHGGGHGHHSGHGRHPRR